MTIHSGDVGYADVAFKEFDQGCSGAFCYEAVYDDYMMWVEIRYIESKLQKGNIYTKAMAPAQFSAERLLIGMQRLSESLESRRLSRAATRCYSNHSSS